MKTIKIHLKAVALFFSILIFFQGCTVYKSTSATLDEAYKSQTKVKVLSNDNQTIKYDKIGLDNRTYYGVKKFKGTILKTQIDENELKSIRLKNEPLSILFTVGGALVTVGGLYGFIFAASFGYL
jgi:hypothetical protein